MRRADALKSELAEPVAAHWPELLAETGCGQLTAAIVIGRTAGVERFRSAASFAMQSGTAPIGCSSGQRQQHRLSRGGDRPTEPCAAHHRDDSCLSSSPVNALSLGSVALGWFASRLTETRPDRLTKEERKLAVAKDGLTLAALATGIASGVLGARLAREAPEGAVPIERGTKPTDDTPRGAARTQRSLAGLGVLNIASGVGLVVVNALLAQRNHSRPPLRRALLRRS
jgi:hypothetical protein